MKASFPAERPRGRPEARAEQARRRRSGNGGGEGPASVARPRQGPSETRVCVPAAYLIACNLNPEAPRRAVRMAGPWAAALLRGMKGPPEASAHSPAPAMAGNAPRRGGIRGIRR